MSKQLEAEKGRILKRMENLRYGNEESIRLRTRDLQARLDQINEALTMPLTPELIDAAMFPPKPLLTEIALVIGGNRYIFAKPMDAPWRWRGPNGWEEVPEECQASLNKIAPLYHLAEARRMGVPAWTLEELWQIRSEWVGRITGGLSSEFLTHLKSLPNA